jgi:CTP:molybdopterin cytidylyltransferase MocA
VVHAHEKDLVEVEVDDPGILTDIDTPQAYRKAFGRELAPERRPGAPARGGRR